MVFVVVVLLFMLVPDGVFKCGLVCVCVLFFECLVVCDVCCLGLS